MKHLVSAFIFLILLYACSREEISDGEDSGEEICAVSFTPATIDAVVTKATSPLSEGSEVMVSAYSILSGTESASCSQNKLFTISDTEGSMSSCDGSNMLVFGNTSYMFYAFSPAVPFDEGNQKTLSISQEQDFKLTSTQAMLTGEAQTVTLPAMTRECCFTEFTINLDLTNAKSITSISVGEDGISMNGITHSPAGYVLGEGFRLAAAASDGTLTIPQAGFTTITEGIKYVGGSTVLPKTENTFTITFDIYLNGVRKTATATVPAMAFVPGVYYQFAVNFWDTRVSLTLQIADWNMLSCTGNLGNWLWDASAGAWVFAPPTVTGDVGNNQSPSLPIGEWTGSPETSPDLGDGDLGEITIGEWTISPATVTGDVGNDHSPSLPVEGWTPVETDSGDPGIDRSPVISIGEWTPNPSFAVDLGTNLTSLGVTGWTQSSSAGTDMGAE